MLFLSVTSISISSLGFRACQPELVFYQESLIFHARAVRIYGLQVYEIVCSASARILNFFMVSMQIITSKELPVTFGLWHSSCASIRHKRNVPGDQPGEGGI